MFAYRFYVSISTGCLPLLIQLLHGSDKDSGLLGNTRGSKCARARAAAALHNIVHSHPDDKRGRREARVLRLLEQIRAHCDQLRGDSPDDEEEAKKTGNTGGQILTFIYLFILFLIQVLQICIIFLFFLLFNTGGADFYFFIIFFNTGGADFKIFFFFFNTGGADFKIYLFYF